MISTRVYPVKSLHNPDRIQTSADKTKSTDPRKNVGWTKRQQKQGSRDGPRRFLYRKPAETIHPHNKNQKRRRRKDTSSSFTPTRKMMNMAAAYIGLSLLTYLICTIQSFCAPDGIQHLGWAYLLFDGGRKM